MNNLYVMVGLPGSGKSTIAQEIKNTSMYTIVISRDDIRFSLLKEKDQYFAKEKEVFITFKNKINKYLNEGYDVIADATHLNTASRNKLLKNVHGYNELIAVVADTSIEDCLKRNSKRKGRKKVPDETIKSMANNFYKPTFEEGFDRIICISCKEKDNLV